MLILIIRYITCFRFCWLLLIFTPNSFLTCQSQKLFGHGFIPNLTVTGLCPCARLHHHGHHQARTGGGGHHRDGHVSGGEDDSSEGVRYLDGERQCQDPQNVQGHDPVTPGSGAHHCLSFTAGLLKVMFSVTHMEDNIKLKCFSCSETSEICSLVKCGFNSRPHFDLKWRLQLYALHYLLLPESRT